MSSDLDFAAEELLRDARRCRYGCAEAHGARDLLAELTADEGARRIGVRDAGFGDEEPRLSDDAEDRRGFEIGGFEGCAFAGDGIGV